MVDVSDMEMLPTVDSGTENRLSAAYFYFMKTSSKLGQSNQRNVVWLAVGYGGLFLLILWAAYTNNLPLKLLGRIPYYDKIGHVVLYALASYLGHRVLNRRHFKGIRYLPIFPVLFSLAMTAEEIVQGLSPYRTLDSLDLVCSLGGVVLGYFLAQGLGKRS
ncbi:VanZ family protein [Adonisia turfae]